MGYFDALTDSSFKWSGKNWTFYPWGTLGAGYDIPTNEQYEAIRDWLKRWYKIMLVLLVLGGVTVGWILAGIALVPGCIYYCLKVRGLTQSLESGAERLTIEESLSSQATGHSLVFLWLLEVVSLLFVAAAAFGVWKDPQQWLRGALPIIFFGFCALVFGYMIRLR